MLPVIVFAISYLLFPTYHLASQQQTTTMVFVYTGKGKRSAQNNDAPPEQKLCAKQACAIQWCLAKRDHKEHLCHGVIGEWNDCCEKVRANAIADSAADVLLVKA